MHIVWKCPRWKAIRDPYLHAIERLLKKLNDMPHHLGKVRHKAIKKLINTPCFQLCGICPDAERGASSYNIDVPSPHSSAVTAEQQYMGNELAQVEYIDGVKHYKIYTDGSCSNGTNKILARAGWGGILCLGRHTQLFSPS